MYTERRKDATAPLKEVIAAYEAHMRRHHASEWHAFGKAMNRSTLAECGLAVDEMNMCKACGRHAEAGRCCSEYNGARRAKRVVVKGLALVHEAV